MRYPGASVLHYEVVDVFTDRPFAGNPLAVVLDADDLSGEQLQALAREFNLSETAFPLPSRVADYRLRIFTPTAELPFAGHPSIGSAHTLVRLGRLPAGSVLQECGAGLLPLSVGLVEVSLTGGKPTLGGDLDAGQLLTAVGLEPADGAGRARLAGCGLEFGYLPVTEDAVARAMPDPRALVAALGSDGGGLCVYAWDVDRRTAHARVFAAGVGVAEDPATGSAALGLGVHLAAAGLLPSGTSAYTVHQGAELQRPSVLRCTAVVRGETAVQVTVTGSVVPIAKGTIRVP
ncbi:MAG: PhzF family phenazine biosynthesis protein [Actinomycetota bacterium]|nr:PhzF family phenazine biosynthesis protein [Actinomycetota bacterium]